MENQLNKPQQSATNTKTVLGLILVAIGLMIFSGRIHFFLFPHFLFTWPVVMIIIGLYIGAKNNYRNNKWILITMIGVIFLLPNIIHGLYIVTCWPLLMIAIGMAYIFRGDNGWGCKHTQRQNNTIDNNIK
jgi:hypothetical protein